MIDVISKVHMNDNIQDNTKERNSAERMKLVKILETQREPAPAGRMND